MNRSPGDGLRSLGLGLLVACLLATGARAGAVRGIYRPGPPGARGATLLPADVPRFDAVALHADSPEHAQQLALRLGFTVTRRDGHGWRVTAPFAGRGAAIVWRDARRDPSFGAQGRLAPVPLEDTEFLPADHLLPLGIGRPAPATAGLHPNGVTGIAYMIGLVPSITTAARAWPPERTRDSGGVPLLDFHPRVTVPALGARASDADGAAFGGAVRLLEPAGATGFAAERLGRGAGGWVGFGLATIDLERTAAWFDAHGVAYARDAVAGRITLRLDPAETDGWLVEVVGPPRLPTP